MTLVPDAPLASDAPAASGSAAPGTPLTPPPTSGAADQGAPRPPRRTSSKVVATIAICAGAVLIAGTVFTGVLSAMRSATIRDGEATVSASGLRSLDLDTSAADVTVSYGAVSEATLRVTGASGIDDWTFEREGDRLVVSSDRNVWGRWGWFREPDTVELTLPASAAGVDADIDVDSGSLRADGDFGALDLHLDAGSLRVSGTADALTSEVSAGSARYELSGVSDARLSVSAGSVEGELDGRAPDALTLDVSAGRLDLTVPDGEYALTSDVSAGRFTHDLRTDPASPNRVDVTVSAGAVTLRTAD
ncbi:hypothetical protein [Microbacterium sp. PA5]|uniref:hypothetical protein n=1 Tax=Microbacterium sp. PA5 TaxID=3416654 RepID=UPI003CF7AF91